MSGPFDQNPGSGNFGPSGQSGFSQAAQGGFGAPPPGTGGFGGPPPGTGGGNDTTIFNGGGPWHQGGPSETAPTLSRSPLWILWLAIAVPVATLGFVFLEGLEWHIAGWAIAVFGSMLLVWFFTVKDLQARLKPFIDQPGLLRALRIGALAAGILIGFYHAYLIADVVARWDVWV